MENVDRMIIDSFCRLKCSFCEEGLPNLNELTTDNVVEAVVRFLWACDPKFTKTIQSYSMSSQTTARFKMATTLAQALKDLGIRDEFGYQAFLYHSIFDVRRIFLALVDKLPEESLIPETNLTPLEQLKMEVGAAIKQNICAPWVPEFCRHLRMKYDGRFWHPSEGQSETIRFQSHHNSQHKKDHRQTICSILEGIEQENFDVSGIDFPSTSVHFDALGGLSKICPPLVAKKPKLSPKPEKLKMQSAIAVNAESFDVSLLNTSSSAISPRSNDAELDALVGQVAEKTVRQEEKRRDLIELRYAQVRVEEDIERLKNKRELIDFRFLQLLQDPEESIAKLEKIVDEADTKRVDLQESFNEIRNAKMVELEKRRAESRTEDIGAMENLAEKDAELLSIREKFEQLKALIAERTRIKAKLEKELRKVGRHLPGAISERSKYVKRVMEIIASVNKQNDEIFRTVKSVKKLEHDISTLSGNLDRTFTVVNGWLGNRSEGDAKMQKAYRLLVRMHDQCTSIKAAINERGQIVRRSDELTSQIETHRSTDTQLEQILSDLLQIRQENATLAKQIERKKQQN